ncbi:MAG: lysophospholipid acyltransferase family protein [Anaerolineae bacterium]
MPLADEAPGEPDTADQRGHGAAPVDLPVGEPTLAGEPAAAARQRVVAQPMSLPYRLTFKVLEVLFEHYFKAEVSGRENLPPPGVPTLLVPNHTSAIDVPASGYALRRPGSFVAKAEATRLPLVGPYLKAVGAIPANRDQQDTEALRRAMNVLKSGGLMGIAPEGTRSPDGSLGPYDPGFVWLALRTGAVVVPMAIHGTHELMPKSSKIPRRGTVRIRFGEPISFADEGRRASRDRLQELADEVRARTVAMLADLAAESAASDA